MKRIRPDYYDKFACIADQCSITCCQAGTFRGFKEENPDTPVITMSMGKMGMISRLCGESFGSAITFAAHKKASAPGQMEMHEVADILERMHKIIK